MTAILSTVPRTHDTPHQQCEQCSYPPFNECCDRCTARAAFLAHVLAPLTPAPAALARAA